MSDLGQIYVENNSHITASNIKIIKMITVLQKQEKKIQRRQLRRQSVRRGKGATDEKTCQMRRRE